jgi:hypothetical protein
MTPDDLATAFTNLAETRLADVPQRMIDAGLPADATDAITAEVAVALAGAQRAVASFTARPPLTDAAEEAALLDLLTGLADAAVSDTVTSWVIRAQGASVRASATLRDWNTQRQERAEPSEYAVVKQMRSRRIDGSVYEPIDAEHFTREDLGDGRFRIHHSVRPMPEDRE